MFGVVVVVSVAVGCCVVVLVDVVVVGGVIVMVGLSDGLGIVPSRYPVIPLRSAAIPIRPFQATQFVPSNLSVSEKIGGRFCDMFVVVDFQVVVVCLGFSCAGRGP
jgi:hypothetical protein